MNAIDEYIKKYDGLTRQRLEAVRGLIESQLPSYATPALSYGMPTYRINDYNTIQFALNKPLSEELIRKITRLSVAQIDDKLPKIGAPATRALREHLGVTRLSQLGEYSEKELLSLHGFGPKAIELLKPAIKNRGITFKK